MRWISTKNQLPPDHTEILIYSGDIFMGYRYDSNKDKRDAARKHKDKYLPLYKWMSFPYEYPEFDDACVTHWMELPERPDE